MFKFLFQKDTHWKGSLMSCVVRYFMSSQVPSGGTNEMALSVSNLPSRTHWWNWMSSMATTVRPLNGKRQLEDRRRQEAKRIGGRTFSRRRLAGSDCSIVATTPCRWYQICTLASRTESTSSALYRQRSQTIPDLNSQQSTHFTENPYCWQKMGQHYLFGSWAG